MKFFHFQRLVALCNECIIVKMLAKFYFSLTVILFQKNRRNQTICFTDWTGFYQVFNKPSALLSREMNFESATWRKRSIRFVQLKRMDSDEKDSFLLGSFSSCRWEKERIILDSIRLVSITSKVFQLKDRETQKPTTTFVFDDIGNARHFQTKIESSQLRALITIEIFREIQ